MSCDVSWTESDPILPHDAHSCVFVAAVHSRHECECGLNIHANRGAA